MASSTVTGYYDGTNHYDFALVSTSAEKTVWRVAGRPLSNPWEISLSRKIGQSGQKANDHVILKQTLIANNAATGLPATASVSIDISIPRDTTTITPSTMEHMVAVCASIINENAVFSATIVNATKLVTGTDL